MREIIFRIILHLLIRQTPGCLQSLEIQILLNTTAKAFYVRGKRVWNLTPRRALREYAEFTRSCMADKPVDADSKRLYEQAFKTGSMVRRITGFKHRQDIERLIFYLYRNIGINMTGRIPGDLVVRRCYFSRFYSPGQCVLMSSVDSGIIAGIAGGGRLHFKQRLTEGCRTCRACFTISQK